MEVVVYIIVSTGVFALKMIWKIYEEPLETKNVPPNSPDYVRNQNDSFAGAADYDAAIDCGFFD